MASKSELATTLAQIRELARSAMDTTSLVPGSRQLVNYRVELAKVAADLRAASEQLDPVLRPESVFDPTDPKTGGRVVALTLVAQDRHPLGSVPAFYGSGVYAIYYTGKFDAYKPLRGQEHPIYVGKADPDSVSAKDPVAQGTKLSDRLREHAKSIRAASTTLNIEDFECRLLIVQTGFQKSAEDYLIGFFKPIWNSETKLCFGLGKHGDSSTTRVNKRSPWDTLHPGRPWAHAINKNQKEEPLIREQIAAHFAQHPPFVDFRSIFASFMADMRQLTAERFRSPTTSGAITAAEAFGESEAKMSPRKRRVDVRGKAAPARR